MVWDSVLQLGVDVSEPVQEIEIISTRARAWRDRSSCRWQHDGGPNGTHLDLDAGNWPNVPFGVTAFEPYGMASETGGIPAMATEAAWLEQKMLPTTVQ